MYKLVSQFSNCLRIGKENFASPVSTIFQHRNFCANKEKESVELDYKKIVGDDKELEHKLKVIVLESDVMRQEGKAIPDFNLVRESDWKELLNLPNRSQRIKYLEFLFKKTKSRENRQLKKEQKKLEREQSLPEKKGTCEDFEEFVKTYNLQNNSIFLRFYESTINQFYNNRLIQAIRFGQKLVIDCSYDKDMTRRENINCAKQLMLLFAENRMHDDPFDLHFCNADLQSDLITHLHKHIPTMYEPHFPLNIHKESYLDLFPKENLVYLTPHCREEVSIYDHEAVYIIGALVDKTNNAPLSLAKAKREGIRMAKLPLDRYLQWGSGSGKSLTLNQVTSILLDVKHTDDWSYALRHVPRRKLIEFSMNQNVERTSNKMSPRTAPSNQIDFNKLKFRNREPWRPKEREKIDIKSIINE